MNERWESQAIVAMDRFRTSDPEGWSGYLAKTGLWDNGRAPA